MDKSRTKFLDYLKVLRNFYIYDTGHGQDLGWTSDSGKEIILSPSMTGVRIMILNLILIFNIFQTIFQASVSDLKYSFSNTAPASYSSGSSGTNFGQPKYLHYDDSSSVVKSAILQLESR